MRYYLVIFLLSLVLSTVSASASTPQVVNELLSTGEYEKALVEAESGLQKKPNNLRLMLQKGFILIRLRRLSDAEKYYLGLIERLPENPEPLNNLGVIYQLQKRYDQAIALFEQTITRFPEFSRAYENLGDTYIQVATETYLKGRDKTPDDKMLRAKAELGQQFYRIASENTKLTEKETGSPSNQVTLNPDTRSTQEDQSPQRDIQSEVLEFLKSWTTNWSRKNLDAYFDLYADEFVPEGYGDRATWERRKASVISSAEFIRIRLEAIKITKIQEDQVTVSFTQHYESDSHKDQVIKTLALKRYNAYWRIIGEA